MNVWISGLTLVVLSVVQWASRCLALLLCRSVRSVSVMAIMRAMNSAMCQRLTRAMGFKLALVCQGSRNWLTEGGGHLRSVHRAVLTCAHSAPAVSTFTQSLDVHSAGEVMSQSCPQRDIELHAIKVKKQWQPSARFCFWPMTHRIFKLGFLIQHTVYLIYFVSQIVPYVTRNS